MQAHILSLHTPLAPGWGLKVKTFFILKEVMLHIKLKGMELRAPASTYSVLTHILDLWVGLW